jgi:hypothetical protein
MLIGGEIVKLQLWRTAAGSSPFEQNFNFNAGAFLRHFSKFHRSQEGQNRLFLGGSVQRWV